MLPWMSELDLQENEPLVFSQNQSTSGYTNSSKSKSDEKDLDIQKKFLDCWLNNKKQRKLKKRKNIHTENKIHKCS